MLQNREYHLSKIKVDILHSFLWLPHEHLALFCTCAIKMPNFHSEVIKKLYKKVLLLFFQEIAISYYVSCLLCLPLHVPTAVPFQNCPQSETHIKASYSEIFGKWYKLNNQYVPFAEAYSSCKADGAKIVEPRTLLDFYAIKWFLEGTLYKNLIQWQGSKNQPH